MLNIINFDKIEYSKNCMLFTLISYKPTRRLKKYSTH